MRLSDKEFVQVIMTTLLSLAISTLTAEKMQELCDERDKLIQEVEHLRKATAKSLWMNDLDALERKIIEVRS